MPTTRPCIHVYFLSFFLFFDKHRMHSIQFNSIQLFSACIVYLVHLLLTEYWKERAKKKGNGELQMRLLSVCVSNLDGLVWESGLFYYLRPSNNLITTHYISFVLCELACKENKMITDLQIQFSIKESAFGAISLSSSLFFFFLIGLIRQMSRARTTKAVRVMALKISRAFLDLYSRNRYKATPIIPIPVIHIPATATHTIIFCFWVAIFNFQEWDCATNFVLLWKMLLENDSLTTKVNL